MSKESCLSLVFTKFGKGRMCVCVCGGGRSGKVGEEGGLGCVVCSYYLCH